MGCTSDEGGNQSRRFHIMKVTVTNLRDEALKALCEFNTAPPSKTEWYAVLLIYFFYIDIPSLAFSILIKCCH